MQGVALVNLKKTGGGSKVDPELIRSATEANRSALVQQIQTIAPHGIFLAGTVTQDAFDCYLLEPIRSTRALDGAKVSKIYHPSYQYMNGEQYYQHVKTRMLSAQVLRCLTTG